MSKKSEERAARAAALLREQQRRERRRQILMVGGVLAALVAIVGAGFLINSLRDPAQDVADKAPAAGASDYGVTIGDSSAPHSIVIYEDFLCPYCGQLEAATHSELADLAEQGKVLVDYRPFNQLGADYSVDAAAAFKVVLDASGSEVAKKFHDVLYENQPDESGPYPDSDWLVDKAVEAGASEADVRSGIEDGDGDDWVEKATESARSTDLPGTPTILLDGEMFTDGRTIEDISANLLTAVQ